MAEMLPKALLAQKVAAVAVGSPCSRFFSSKARCKLPTSFDFKPLNL